MLNRSTSWTSWRDGCIPTRTLTRQSNSRAYMGTWHESQQFKLSTMHRWELSPTSQKLGNFCREEKMPLDATNKPPSDNIESLEAFISSFEEGADVALRKLEGKDDPDSIRRRLAILNREGRYLEAADLVRGLKPQEGWCEQAVIAFVRNNEGEKAKQIIEWSKLLDNRNTRHRCILAF